MNLKFKRNSKSHRTVTWDPANGIEYPFEHISDMCGKNPIYRGKEVVKLNGQYVQLITSYNDFDASSKDQAIVAPVTLCEK